MPLSVAHDEGWHSCGSFVQWGAAWISATSLSRAIAAHGWGGAGGYPYYRRNGDGDGTHSNWADVSIAALSGRCEDTGELRPDGKTLTLATGSRNSHVATRMAWRTRHFIIVAPSALYACVLA